MDTVSPTRQYAGCTLLTPRGIPQTMIHARALPRTRRLRIALILAVAALLALPAGASAMVVENTSIRGVALGMTRAEVRAEIGYPKRIIKGTNDFGAYRIWVYRKLRVTIQGGSDMKHSTVSGVSTTRKTERTAMDIGVGSTLAEVKAAYVQITCTKVSATKRLCQLGGENAGDGATIFRLTSKVVKSVEVQTLLD